MRSYLNASQDLIECFEECSFNLIPRVHNCVDDPMATLVEAFKVPMHPIRKYDIELRHRPFVPDNVKNWKVFKDDKQIHSFLTLTGEFKRLVVDEENELQKETPFMQEPLQINTMDPKEVLWLEGVTTIENGKSVKAEEVWEPE